MYIICKECNREFQDFSYLKGNEHSNICNSCHEVMEVAMEQDDYKIFTDYLEGVKVN